MKKLLLWSVPVKSLAALLFAGFIFLYMIAGSFHSIVSDEIFEFAIPFSFAIQSAVLSVVIALLYALMFSEVVIRKMRYFQRIAIFVVILIPILAFHVWLFYSTIWLIVAVGIGIGIMVGAFVLDRYFRLIGKKYTNALESFKANIE